MGEATRGGGMLTVAGIQLACGADREENFGRALDLARIAVERGARIVCFAECFAWPWFPRKAVEENRKLAEPIPDLPNYQERFYFRPGNLGFPVFRTRHAVIGVQTCWDNFFPEGARALALKGAQIIFCPTACSTMSGAAKWERAIIGHAVYNSLYAVRVNRVGTEGSMTFYGKSFCVDPNGDFVTEPTGADEGVVLADLDLDRIKLVRDDWAFFPDRRPGI